MAPTKMNTSKVLQEWKNSKENQFDEEEKNKVDGNIDKSDWKEWLKSA